MSDRKTPRRTLDETAQAMKDVTDFKKSLFHWPDEVIEYFRMLLVAEVDRRSKLQREKEEQAKKEAGGVPLSTLAKNLGIPLPKIQVPITPFSWRDEFNQEEIDLLKANMMVSSVKKFKERVGCSLREAVAAKNRAKARIEKGEL